MWSRIKPKKMYLNIFLYSCIVVSLLTLVFTMFLSQQFVRNAIDEMDKSNQEKMKQVIKTSEFTLQKLRQFALRVYSDESIALWMNMEKNDYSPLVLNKAATSVREFMSSEPFIHGIYLINFNIDQIYTSESSIYSTQDFYDQIMLNYIKGQKTPYLQYVNHEVDGESYLALVVPAAGPNQNYQGFVAILFSKPLLNENMLQISEEDQNKIYIEGKNKEFILGNTDSALTKALMEMDKPAAEPNWKWKSGNETWSIQSERLPIEGWNVYHLSPISLWQAKVTKIRIEIIGSSVFLLLALLLFLFWQSYRSLKPISDLALQIKSKLGKEHPVMQTMNTNNEMAWIHSGFHSLVEKIEQLDLSIKSSKALVKDDFLRQWILNSKSSKPIEEFIRIQTQILSTGWFRMAIIRLESFGRFDEHYDFASRKLLRFAMGNIMAEVLANHGYAAETVDFGSDHIVALISSPALEGDMAQAIGAMEDVRVQIRQWLKLEVHAAVSSVLDVEENLPIIYSQLYELTLMRFINDEDRVFTSEDLERYERGKDSDLDEALLKQVIHSVQLKNEKALEGYFDQLTLHMQELSYEECKLQLTHIIYSIMKNFKNHTTFHGMKSIHSFLEQFVTLGEVKSWIYQEMLQIIDRHGKKNVSSRKEEVAVEMIEYVRNHLHNPMLSVDDVADHVSISVNYARQIFKDHFHCSLSDFITNQRIEHAIKLLTTTDWTVADITEQSGFQTKSTFFSTFKRATGMTPNQYRMEKT
ncbi:helix-turn-helix domain-containing protein [Paenibacillus sp. LMG 31460]|uniref:Helix-turn-helix domain-containing protein n=1 Tax=Paenibacillus germinis TaxID=2654979 RepID=A0ABX1Z057_9BACL|nr:helix-turn-helix domain-containing protein [Paenibacillus germinis]NOU85414.1 helix-turn-helix domain-containing protein [Paenibacillus germinis]